MPTRLPRPLLQVWLPSWSSIDGGDEGKLLTVAATKVRFAEGAAMCPLAGLHRAQAHTRTNGAPTPPVWVTAVSVPQRSQPPPPPLPLPLTPQVLTECPAVHSNRPLWAEIRSALEARLSGEHFGHAAPHAPLVVAHAALSSGHAAAA